MQPSSTVLLKEFLKFKLMWKEESGFEIQLELSICLCFTTYYLCDPENTV